MGTPECHFFLLLLFHSQSVFLCFAAGHPPTARRWHPTHTPPWQAREGRSGGGAGGNGWTVRACQLSESTALCKRFSFALARQFTFLLYSHPLLSKVGSYVFPNVGRLSCFPNELSVPHLFLTHRYLTQIKTGPVHLKKKLWYFLLLFPNALYWLEFRK